MHQFKEIQLLESLKISRKMHFISYLLTLLCR